MSDLVEQLGEIVGSGNVLTGDAVSQRSCSYWDASPLQAKALVLPRTTEEVSRVLELCHARDQAVVPHGGLTGCVRGADAAGDQVVLSLEKMNRIESIDPTGLTATVQAGVILQTLQETVDEQGLYFPLDLGARGSCTIGGNIATNAGGINVIRYGMMRELVLGLEAVLADGTVVSSMNQMLKNNSGYDLKQLFIGSEGTLGIVTRAVVRLDVKPGARHSALVALSDFDAVVNLLQRLQRRLGGKLSAYEVMWGDYVQAVTEPGWHRAPMDRDWPFYALAEATATEGEEDSDFFLEVMQDALEAGIVADAVIPKSEAERDSLWAIREDFEAVLQEAPLFLYDVSLPIKDMQAYVERVKQGVSERWPEARCYVLGHLGDGNLHLFVAPRTGDASLHDASDTEVYTPLADYGGSISAEHGIGLEKKGWLSYTRNEAEIGLMRLLKRTLDPRNLLNPGKIISV